MKLYEYRRRMLRELIGSEAAVHVAERIGISASALSQFLSGARNIGDTAAINLEKSFGVPEGTLTMPWSDAFKHADFSAAHEDHVVDIRVHRLVFADYPPIDAENTNRQLRGRGADPSSPAIEVVTDDLFAYALRMADSSLAPAIRSGWIMWFEPSKLATGGDYVKVATYDGKTLIKELLYANDQEVSLMSINPEYKRITLPASEVQSIDYMAGIMSPKLIKT